MFTHATDLIRGNWRYAIGLRGFLSKTIDLEEAKSILTEQLQNREESFLLVLQKGIYGNPRSPYRRLLEHAGYKFEDVKALVQDMGLEGALSKLYDEGVYVTLDEFKGRTSICRPGLEFPVTAFDFDNPLLTAHYQSTTGGSRGGRTRVDIDLDHIAHEASSTTIWFHCHNLLNHPGVLWRAGPPSMTGLRSLFFQARAGQISVRWFSPIRPAWNRQGVQGRLLMAYTLLVGQIAGRPLPRPKHARDLAFVVSFLSEQVRLGRPAQLNSGPSEWVRICLVAEEKGLNIVGTVFRGGGEPYTEGKAMVLARVGARGIPSYAMQEAGDLGIGCGRPIEPDDMHVMTDRIVIVPKPARLASGPEVSGFFHTSLLTSAPKLMLNVDSGDYGAIEQRDCGCLWQQLGFTTHIHTVRSHEKLTSDGVMFMGSMLHELLEETLPTHFGGGPLDYQLVEEEEDGVTTVSVLASPRIGALDDQAVIEAVLDSLNFADWSRRQADLWRQNKTLRVVRREPYVTGAGKILPLHVLTASSASGAKEAPTDAPDHSAVKTN